VRRFYEEAWSHGKLDVIDELFADDYVRHDLRPSSTSGAQRDEANHGCTPRSLGTSRTRATRFSIQNAAGISDQAFNDALHRRRLTATHWPAQFKPALSTAQRGSGGSV
jgi:hypothetical protein